MSKVVADENIPYVAEAFAGFGPVSVMPAATITAESVRDADLLLVRSVTRVDAGLLAGSRVRFVATATIGTDHVDTEYLASAGIGFAAAPGSNATSVAEWVAAALLALAGRHGVALAGLTLGIVGVGNVGSRVAARAAALGLRTALCDPPRARAGEPGFLPLAEMLARSDIVTVHVPLIRAGEDRTLDLVDEGFFAQWPGKAGGGRPRFFLNSSRGGVVVEAALRAALADGGLTAAALDVWRGEPDISTDTLRVLDIATPHIAGYSFDGKVAGTRMIHEAARRHFALPAEWDPAPLLPPPTVPAALPPAVPDLDPQAQIREVVRQVYDIEADDAALRRLLALPPAERGKWFTRLRKEYPVRREFRFTRADGLPTELRRRLADLGFS